MGLTLVKKHNFVTIKHQDFNCIKLLRIFSKDLSLQFVTLI